MLVVDDEALREIMNRGACDDCVACLDALEVESSVVSIVRHEVERWQRKVIKAKCGDSTVDGGGAHGYACSKNDKT